MSPSHPLPFAFISCAPELLERLSGAGLWRWDPASDQVQASSALTALMGLPAEGWPGIAGLLQAFAPECRDALQTHLLACADTGGHFDCELQLRGGQPSRAWVRLLGQAVYGADGRVAAVEGVVQALTVRDARPAGLLRAIAGLGRGLDHEQAFATLDTEGRFTFLNEAAEALLRSSAEQLLGRRVWNVFQKTVRLRLEEQVRAALAGSDDLLAEELDARLAQWLELRGRPFGGGMAVTLHDVSERRKSQEQLRLLEGSIARLNDVVIITEAGPFNEPGPRIVFVNEAFERRTGWSQAEVLGRTPRLLHGLQTQRDRLNQVRAALQQWRPVRVDLINYRKDGEPFWVDLDISPVWDKARRLTHWVAVGRDVTERKAAEEKIQYLAFYDALTRLPNRQLLLDRLQDCLGRRGGPGEGALMFIDLDNFKVLNDTLGHQKGDLLLQQVAERLRGCVSAGDTVARLGGDEFVILLEAQGRDPDAVAQDAQAIAQRILAALGEPYVLPGLQHHSTCSIGVTLFGPGGTTVGELLKQADLAMYQAKRAGRNTVCFFDPQMQAAASASAALAADLRQGWRQNQFRLYYQPQVDVQGRMSGVEALLRWEHPQRGSVPPSQFIPTAEETTLILELGQWVLEQACAQLSVWATQPGREHLSIAVNVSVRQFRHPEFVDQVMALVERFRVAPRKLKLELTESLLADGIDVTVAKMGNLKALGVALSLDDFGTGYSSLAYLKRLPLDQLKIDREFVRDLLTDANDAAIARTIIELAHSVHLDVIAEGVETEAQRDFLAGQGCVAFQGYLFCEPLAAAALEEFIDRAAR